MDNVFLYILYNRSHISYYDVGVKTIKNFAPISIAPVSYTHLDVYKRQISRQPPMLFFRNSCMEAGEVKYCRPTFVTGRIPVSYTHLNVP